MLRRSIISLMLLLTATVGGCHTPPPAGLNVVVKPIDAQRLGFNYTWSRDLALAEGKRIGHVTLLDDLVIVVEQPGNLMTALSAKDGSIKWMRPWMRPYDRLFHPIRVRDRLLINSETELFQIDADSGEVLDIQKLTSPVRHAPVLVGDLAVFGGFDGRLFAHDLTDGFFAWAHRFANPITARPVYTGQSIFAADTGGHYALLATSGKILQRGRTFDRVSASPAVTELGIFVASEDHTLYALNRLTLQDRWKYRAPRALTHSPIQLGNVVYLRIPGVGTVALDAVEGRQLWRVENLDAIAIHTRDDSVLMSTGEELWRVDSDRGRVLRRIPAEPLHSVLAGHNGMVLLVSRTGRLMRLDQI